MAEIQDSEHCGWSAPHDPHVHGFMWAQFSCPGIPWGTEYRLYVHGIKRWAQLRDEVAPAIRRDFPGVLVISDKRASLELLGLEYKTAEHIMRALASEFGLSDFDKYPEIRALTEEEISRVREHRG